MKPSGRPFKSACEKSCSARHRLRKALQGLIDLLRHGRRPQIRAYLSKIEQLIEGEDWEGAVARAREAAEIAQRAGHPGMLSRIGRLLEQLGEFESAAPIRFAGERKSYRPRGRPWNGETIAGKTLVVDQIFNHLGQQLRHARLIDPAVRRCGRCIVLAEPRLVPILQRTFADADVVDRGGGYAAAHAAADFVTNSWDLAQWFGDTPAKLEAGFVPLKPDADVAARLRADYAARGRPALIGISWGTLNTTRQIPAAADWDVLLSGANASFVSLQYGETAADLEFLGKFCEAPIVNDRAVDQLTDMDRFAAQIASLDLVVSIDNTIAHTASALGARTIVVTYDGPSHWPLRGNRTPWYPTARVVRKRGRNWREVLKEARAHLDAELGTFVA